MVNQEWSPAFVSVSCKCGRGLRAKFEQAGTEVRCWDCHEMVFVPNPRQGQKVARELSEGALVVIKGPGLNSVLAGAVGVTAALAVPTYGVWCSVVVLMLGAWAYGETIGRVGRGASRRPRPGWSLSRAATSILKAIVCLALAAGTVVPLWYLNAGFHQSPHWDGIGRGIASTAWIVLPLLMLMLYGRTSQDAPLGAPKCLRLIARHPFAILLALAVVPATLVLTEAVLGLILYIPGNLPFFALDYMPMPSWPEKPVLHDGIPYYHMIDYRSYPETRFVDAYLDGIGHGYSFVGAVPASLSLPSRAGLNGAAIGLTSTVYVVVRVFLTMVVVTCLLTAFAIQARWLGAIPALENRRPA